jgi:nucleotide-binding universal stress UspA family protein
MKKLDLWLLGIGEILQIDKEVDTIVIGSRGFNAAKEFLLGGVS